MAQIDPLAGYAMASYAMGEHHLAIVPSDTEDLPVRPRAIYCAEDGTAVIRDEDGVDLAYPMTAGTVLAFRGVRLLATGTTGTFYGWW
ncbi:hypothetical protein [Martelella sp. AD-3]|uniref:spike base protein, RCAP_Rcc01079 family n=1 Tax=Martelella sp. AD-3 TaxID=686597 RepID=UPI0004B453DB|nr:hypothetical protein [Martelella sp. AD-3]